MLFCPSSPESEMASAENIELHPTKHDVRSMLFSTDRDYLFRNNGDQVFSESLFIIYLSFVWVLLILVCSLDFKFFRERYVFMVFCTPFSLERIVLFISLFNIFLVVFYEV